MKVTIECETCTYSAENTEIITWTETLGLVRSALISMFPYLTDEDISEYFKENSWSNLDKKKENNENI